MVTRPPVVPEGVKTALLAEAAGMVPTLPLSRPQPTLMGRPARVAVYFTVGMLWPAGTVMVWSVAGWTSRTEVEPPSLPPAPVEPTKERLLPPLPPVLAPPLAAPPVPAPPVPPCVEPPVVTLLVPPHAAATVAVSRASPRTLPRVEARTIITETYGGPRAHRKRQGRVVAPRSESGDADHCGPCWVQKPLTQRLVLSQQSAAVGALSERPEHMLLGGVLEQTRPPSPGSQ